MSDMKTTLTDTLHGLLGDAMMLMRQELALAKAEVAEKVGQAQSGLVSLLTGLLIATCALFVLVQAVIVALSKVLPPWLATTSVGVVLAAIAFVAIRHAEQTLSPRNLKPRRTLDSMSEQVDRVKETLK